jgi:hypothetical protein
MVILPPFLPWTSAALTLSVPTEADAVVLDPVDEPALVEESLF